jgi:hypothetical protein
VGVGDREQSDSGSALLCDRSFLSELLAAMGRELLLLVKLQHYRERSRYDAADEGAGDKFSHSYSLLLVDRTVRARRVIPTPDDLAIISGLDKYSRYDFHKRFRALDR